MWGSVLMLELGIMGSGEGGGFGIVSMSSGIILMLVSFPLPI